MTSREDGMAELRLTAPVPLVQGIHDRLTTMARTVRAEHDAADRAASGRGNPAGLKGESARDRRRIDQLRADLACDLLLAGAPSGHVVGSEGRELLAHVRGTIHVTIPAHVLTDGSVRADDAPGTTAGGPGRPGGVATAGGEPIDPASARRLASDATAWERLFLAADTGALLTVDHYTPTAAQRRFLRARDEHCRFPGCRHDARRCEADHIVPYATGGQTDVGNLESLCKRHHLLKHHSPWRVRHLGGGELEWTSPLGHRYSGRPDSGVRFVVTAPPGDGPAGGEGENLAAPRGGPSGALDPAPF